MIIDSLPPESVTLAEIRDLIGQDGLMLFTAFLTLIFMVPVSIPGVSTVFGTAILLIGISRLFDRKLWLPSAIEKRVISTQALRATLNRSLIWIDRLERISRPHRLRWLTSQGLMEIVNNGALILGAILLIAPFGFIPFSNTFPALALLFLAIGLLQQDGISILFGHLANLATIIYFTALIATGGAAIHEAFQYFFG
ncbi:exopolysaccharide biosynthesis protein [Candidatus Nitrosoglobus terrae]|nr:exopolysaccharide biosynthesis protein [Candidatus Nitrosoglobus terrae]